MTAVELPTDAPERQPMPARSWTATALAGLALLIASVGLVLGFRPSPVQVIVGQNLPGSLATFGLAVLFTVVGLILRRRRVEHSVGWVLLLFGLGVPLVAGSTADQHWRKGNRPILDDVGRHVTRENDQRVGVIVRGSPVGHRRAL